MAASDIFPVAVLLGLAAFGIWFLWQVISLTVAFVRRPGQLANARAARVIRGRMTRMASETLVLVPAKEPGFSKLGGGPDLPASMPWPAGRKRPRTFVAQIDLAAFRQHTGPDWLPSEGCLYAFCDEDGWGFADETQVLYTCEPPGPPSPPPAGVASTFAERRVAFLVAPSIPSTDWLDADLAELDDDAVDKLASVHDEPFGDEIQHRIGGYPSEIQGGQMHVQCELLRRGLDEAAEVTPAIKAAARQWRLLLQIDSDEALGMNWGDGGRLYVFVREKDARAGDFTKTIALSQTH